VSSAGNSLLRSHTGPCAAETASARACLCVCTHRAYSFVPSPRQAHPSKLFCGRHDYPTSGRCRNSPPPEILEKRVFPPEPTRKRAVPSIAVNWPERFRRSPTPNWPLRGPAVRRHILFRVPPPPCPVGTAGAPPDSALGEPRVRRGPGSCLARFPSHQPFRSNQGPNIRIGLVDVEFWFRDPEGFSRVPHSPAPNLGAGANMGLSPPPKGTYPKNAESQCISGWVAPRRVPVKRGGKLWRNGQ